MRLSPWIRKFRDAFRGVAWAVRTQSSMWVHVLVATLVVVLAVCLRIPSTSFAILWLAIGAVMAAEVFNTGLEQLVKSLHPEHDERVGLALDMAAGAVLVMSMAAVLVGLWILGPPLVEWITQTAPS